MSRQSYLPLSEDPTWAPQAPPCLDGIDEVELDAESTGVDWTRGDRPVGWAIGYAGRTQYLPFAHRAGGNLCEATVKRWAERELRGKRIRNHTTKFDLHMARVWGVDLREQGNTFHDVSHSEALLDDHERRFNLQHIAQKRLGLGKLDAGPKQGIGDQHASAVAAYAERDVALVRQLADHYAPLLAAEDLGRVAALEDAVIPVVVEIESNGMPLDLELLEQWNRESQALLEKLTHELYRTVGFKVNPDSTDDMARLWRHCGLPILHYTSPKNPERNPKPSFKTDVVEAAAGEHPAIQLAWRIGKLSDLRSKFHVKYRHDQVDGLLYPHLNQLPTDEGGTVSGRFSGTLQQIMNADKYKRAYGWVEDYGYDFRVKRVFRAPDGFDWISADMKQCEFRIFSHYSASPRLLKAYADNPDVNFHGIVDPLVRRVRPDIDKTGVKIFNFQSIYGGGVGAASRSLKISHELAQEISDVYHAEFPEVRQLLNRCMGVANERGYVRSFLGRRSRFLGSPGNRERVHKALNAVVQPTAADANKLALVVVYEQRKALAARMLMTVHDSLESLRPKGLPLEPYAQLLNEQRLALRVPLLWDVKVGPTWAGAK